MLPVFPSPLWLSDRFWDPPLAQVWRPPAPGWFAAGPGLEAAGPGLVRRWPGLVRRWRWAGASRFGRHLRGRGREHYDAVVEPRGERGRLLIGARVVVLALRACLGLQALGFASIAERLSGRLERATWAGSSRQASARRRFSNAPRVNELGRHERRWHAYMWGLVGAISNTVERIAQR